MFAYIPLSYPFIGSGLQMYATETQACCGQVIEKSTHACCAIGTSDPVAYDVELEGCCAGVVYDKAGKVCCQEHLYSTQNEVKYNNLITAKNKWWKILNIILGSELLEIISSYERLQQLSSV